MAEIKTVVRLSGEELKEVVCKSFNLDCKKSTIRINHIPGNQREPEYTEVIVEANLLKS